MIKVLCTTLDAEMSLELKRLDLIQGQFAVLMTLMEEEGLTQAEIGKKILMPGYATTRNIDALEEKQLVERRKSEQSRRSYCIHLTSRGRSLAPKLFGIVRGVNERLLSNIEPSEQAQLAVILEKLVNAKLGR